jgi:hypothetical protein
MLLSLALGAQYTAIVARYATNDEGLEKSREQRLSKRLTVSDKQ